jgi:hypothetical protein
LNPQVFLIFFNLDSRGPSKAPYTDDEKIMSKNFLDMYYTFATTGKPTFGTEPLEPVQTGGKIMTNEILSSKDVVKTEVNSTFGNSQFWDSLEINEN